MKEHVGFIYEASFNEGLLIAHPNMTSSCLGLDLLDGLSQHVQFHCMHAWVLSSSTTWNEISLLHSTFQHLQRSLIYQMAVSYPLEPSSLLVEAWWILSCSWPPLVKGQRQWWTPSWHYVSLSPFTASWLVNPDHSDSNFTVNILSVLAAEIQCVAAKAVLHAKLCCWNNACQVATYLWLAINPLENF